MNKTIRQLLHEAKTLALTEGERTHLKEQLLLFVRNSNAGRFVHHQTRHSSFVSTVQRIITQPMPIFIALVILLSGGTSLAAQGALPGDVLYPVKVHVNEPVRGMFTFSDQAKAKLDAQLATARLEEAEELAVRTELNADTRAKIETAFKAHADRVESRIAAFQDTDAHVAADVAANFETSLKAHDRILSNIGTSVDGTTKTEVESLRVTLHDETKDADEHRALQEHEVTAQADVKAAAEGRLTAAENKIAEVSAFIDARADVLGTTGTAQARTRLQIASDLVVQGKAKLAAGASGEAFVLFGKAHAAAQQAKILVMAKVRFERHPRPTPTPTAKPSTSDSPNPTASAAPKPSVEMQAESRTSADTSTGSAESSGEIKINIGL